MASRGTPEDDLDARYLRMLKRLRPVHDRGIRWGLQRVQEALRTLGNPHKRFIAVQVAGTNGKGSVCAMLDSIARAGGLRVGLFTSPHLHRLTERFRLNGHEAGRSATVSAFERVQSSGIPLTFFETTFLMSVVLMSDAGVELGVFETGLGGRLDAVTALQAPVCAIVSVGLDHTDVLGPDVESIAREKAAIIGGHSIVICGDLPGAALAEVTARVRQTGARMIHLATGGADYEPDVLALAGRHQTHNAAVAAALAREVGLRLGRDLKPCVAPGLASVRWPARIEILPETAWAWSAPVTVDCAHNPDAVKALVESLPHLPKWARPHVLVVSVMRDKDALGILDELAPLGLPLVVTQAPNPRSMEPQALAALASAVGFRNVELCQEPYEALRRAQCGGRAALVTGSLFLVADLRAKLLGEATDAIAYADPAAGQP